MCWSLKIFEGQKIFYDQHDYHIWPQDHFLQLLLNNDDVKSTIKPRIFIVAQIVIVLMESNIVQNKYTYLKVHRVSEFD